MESAARGLESPRIIVPRRGSHGGEEGSDGGTAQCGLENIFACSDARPVRRWAVVARDDAVDMLNFGTTAPVDSTAALKTSAIYRYTQILPVPY